MAPVRTLIIDDEQSLLFVLTDVFDDDDRFEIIGARLNIPDELPPSGQADLVLLDASVGVDDLADTISTLRDQGHGQVVVQTGHVCLAGIEPAAAKAAAVITKPLRLDTFPDLLWDRLMRPARLAG